MDTVCPDLRRITRIALAHLKKTDASPQFTLAKDGLASLYACFPVVSDAHRHVVYHYLKYSGPE
jgi:hypothetical protein